MHTVNSYMRTADRDCVLHIVDNASDSDVIEYLRGLHEMGVCEVTLNDRNLYPGQAANIGWDQAPPEAEYLHRSDNDVEYLEGWPEAVRTRFWRGGARLGQVSMRTDEEELFQDAVGGNNVIKRKVFHGDGVRYTERPWSEVPWEDGDFNLRVRRANWHWGRVDQPCIVHVGDKMLPHIDLDDPYYARTYAERGIGGLLAEAKREKVNLWS